MVSDAILTYKCTQYFHDIDDEVLKEFTGKFLIVYLDDILIFSQNKEEHLRHLKLVLMTL